MAFAVGLVAASRRWHNLIDKISGFRNAGVIQENRFRTIKNLKYRSCANATLVLHTKYAVVITACVMSVGFQPNLAAAIVIASRRTLFAVYICV